MSADGRAAGAYVHGVFSGDEFRAAFLGAKNGADVTSYEKSVDDALDALAEQLERELDLDAMLSIAAAQAG
jgi:adenosylcobyric acid synthase